MFRWLKDRSKKARKPSPSASQRSKEDDYGFKQPHLHKQQQQQQQGDIYKRDLPPTPADVMASAHVMADDDRSLHIYEEIPDLPFRCTPEGELRITLAREQARKVTPPPKPAPGYGPRNISPYMVVPLEKVRETPSELRPGFPGETAPLPPKAGVGRDSASPGSCCGSSVFGSPLLAAGAGGDGGGDISDRLLNAINLTRLLAAVRLSSSSADTCTTSPICIGVDKDGRNISVSVSVTPTTPTPNPPPQPHHHHNSNATNDKEAEDGSRLNTITTTVTGGSSTTSLPVSSHINSKSSGALAASVHSLDSTVTGAGLASQATSVGRRRGSGLVLQASPVRGKKRSTLASEASPVGGSKGPGVASEASPVGGSKGPGVASETSPVGGSKGPGLASEASPVGGSKGLASEASPVRGSEECGVAAEGAGQAGLQDVSRGGFRLVPSPTEQSAIWEVLQLKPGESAELDPPTIDALILKLCSHTLQADSSLLPSTDAAGSQHHHHQQQLHSKQLQELEDMLRELVKTGEGDSHPPSSLLPPPSSSSSSLHPQPSTSSSSSLPQRSPGARRAENSDTGFEYDLSTSSESDQTSYDYFLSKVARTRSLECEVKKLIRTSSSGEEEEEGEGEEEEGEGESFSTVSTSTTTTTTTTTTLPPRSPHEDGVARDSDDGTMADLSESENSSGYYETTAATATAATTTTTTTATSHAVAAQVSTTGCEQGEIQGGRGGQEEEEEEVDVPCYELDCRADPGSSQAQLYSHICQASGRPHPSPSSSSSRAKTGAGGRKSRHHHHHHHHHHKAGGGREGGGGGGREGREEGGVDNHTRRYSLREADLDPAGDPSPASTILDLRRASADAATSPPKPLPKPKPKAKAKPSSDYSYSFLHGPSSKPRSKGRHRHKTPHPHHHPPPHLERSSSLHSRHSIADEVYGSRRQTSEVYSIPAALPDPSGTGGAGAEARGLKSSVSAPSQLSAARHVRESSEVYGTRAGLERCHNRLLSDLIMLNYNRQVLNM